MGCKKLTYRPEPDFRVIYSTKELTPKNSSQKAYSSYLYGFNGKLKDDEIKGSGNSYDFGARIYDPRLGRTPSMDAKAHLFPGVSPYSYANNNPILFVDPDGKVVVAVNEAARRNILNTLSPKDRKYVKFKKDGTLKVSRLSRAQSESGNYKALLTLTKSETVYKFVVAKSYPNMNKEGKSVPLVGDDENGTKGVTLLPGAKYDPSPDGDVWIYTSDKLSEEKQAENTAHEGYGHAYFYELLQQGEDVNPNHKYEGTLIEIDPKAKDPLDRYAIGREDTNIPLKNQIEGREKEAIKNYNAGKDKK